jgi:hypothetical protein
MFISQSINANSIGKLIAKFFKFIHLEKAFSLLFVGNVLKESERPWKTAISYFIPFLLIFLIIERSTLVMGPSLQDDGHLLLSLNKSYAEAFCGKSASGVSLFNANTDLYKPLNQLDTNLISSCESAKPSLFNELSLSRVYTTLFKLFPTYSLNDINFLLNILKFSTVALFALVLFRIGLSPFFILFTSVFASYFISSYHATHSFSLYSFLIPCFLVVTSMAVLTLNFIRKNLIVFISFGLLTGTVAAFYGNLRTSHLPIALLSLCMMIFTIFLYNKINYLSLKNRFIYPICCLVSVITGYHLYNAYVINPVNEAFTSETGTSDYTFHTIAHPLVLALGIEDSDLAKKEGIRWNDPDGLILAQKINPNVTYLGKGYEKALFVYYIKLWLYYPADMLNIYLKKISNLSAVKSNIGLVNDRTDWLSHNIIKTCFNLLSFANSSFLLFSVLLMSCLLIFINYKKFSLEGFYLSMLFIGACFILVSECILIFHQFVFNYHALLNFLYLLILFYYLQLLLNFGYKALAKRTDT